MTHSSLLVQSVSGKAQHYISYVTSRVRKCQDPVLCRLVQKLKAVEEYIHTHTVLLLLQYKDNNCSFHIFRHYLPVLKYIPTQYIYEPWTAPESVQKAAKCIIGKDYPVPMVDHTHVSRINMERMRQVYKTLLISSTVSGFKRKLDLPKIPKSEFIGIFVCKVHIWHLKLIFL